MSRDASPTQSGSPDDAGEVPGYAAKKPRQIPPGGWFQILRRSLKEVRDDHLTLIAGGVAYSWFLALFPALIAAVLIYGLVTDPAQVESQVKDMAGGLPNDAQSLITTQLKSIAGGSGGFGLVVEILAQVVRWAVLTGAVILALGLIYRVGPDREAPAVRWLSLGSVIAAVIWIAASVGFSFYVDNFGRYGKTYGALAGVVVLLIWFWITALVVLLGAEINAETEAQTVRDTTTGDPRPIGTRGAVKADEPPPTS